jgi:hypothetical protein
MRRGVEHEKLQRQGSPGGLSVPDLVGRGCAVRVHQEADQARIRQELAQQFEPLRQQGGIEHKRSGAVATRPIDAFNEAVLDRIIGGRKDDRDRCGRGLRRFRWRSIRPTLARARVGLS